MQLLLCLLAASGDLTLLTELLCRRCRYRCLLNCLQRHNQARHRRHTSLSARKGEGQKFEFEYTRKGALSYLAAWDVRRAKLFGRCEAKTGIAPFTRLVQDVMACEPHCSAERVFRIIDNGSSHRGLPSVNRLQGKWPQIIVVHLPIHASWLNQIEIYFSILQRKVLTPNGTTLLQRSIRNQTLRFLGYVKEADKERFDELTSEDIRDFLSRLALRKRVSSATQNQAFNALPFLFRNVLDKETGNLDKTLRRP